ncbi:hypothetical protein BJ944DRAFT_243218 [Cunninghamella echinulata]|nr:hypothetical protein BJ944DRAFT_243218 [Cunninghamella echinulata]
MLLGLMLIEGVFLSMIPKCHGSPRASFNGDSAIIFTKYNDTDKNDEYKPGCVLVAQWLRNYGDINFGEDNCLYNSKGRMIGGQCCQNKNNLHKTINPYR